jgi:hypothetical protein
MDICKQTPDQDGKFGIRSGVNWGQRSETKTPVYRSYFGRWFSPGNSLFRALTIDRFSVVTVPRHNAAHLARDGNIRSAESFHSCIPKKTFTVQCN